MTGKSGDNSDTFHQDSMPENRNIRDKLRLIEAQCLSVVADEIIKHKRSGATITHTIDSTTRKVVGTFVGQGVRWARVSFSSGAGFDNEDER